MSYQVRFTFEASDDLERLFHFLAEKDRDAALRAIEAIRKGLELLQTFPFSCRKVDDVNPLYREILISFGSSGYVALFEIEQAYVSILAVRHQSEVDYY